MMDQRDFIGILAGGLLAAPLAVETQPVGKVYRIGRNNSRLLWVDGSLPSAFSAPSWSRAWENCMNQFRPQAAQPAVSPQPVKRATKRGRPLPLGRQPRGSGTLKADLSVTIG